MINLGDTGITKMRLGTTKVSKAYLGSDQVFGDSNTALYRLDKVTNFDDINEEDTYVLGTLFPTSGGGYLASILSPDSGYKYIRTKSHEGIINDNCVRIDTTKCGFVKVTYRFKPNAYFRLKLIREDKQIGVCENTTHLWRGSNDTFCLYNGKVYGYYDEMYYSISPVNSFDTYASASPLAGNNCYLYKATKISD